MSRLALLAIIPFSYLSIMSAHALDQLSIDINQIKSNDWQLKGASLSLFDITQAMPKLALSVKQLILPKPFSNIKFFDVQCLSFNWQANQILCEQGKARLNAPYVNSSPFDFSFSVTEKKSHFNIKNLKIFQGILFLNAKLVMGNWQLKLKSKNIQLPLLKPLLAEFIEDISNGSANIALSAKGYNFQLNTIQLKTDFKKISLQAQQGNVAMENLNFSLQLEAEQKQGVWSWKNKNHLSQGELYIAPVYQEVKAPGIELKTQGIRYKNGQIELQQAQLIQENEVAIHATGLISTKPNILINKAHFLMTIDDLGVFSQHYILPFMQETGLEGLQFNGQLQTQVEWDHAEIEQMSIKLGLLKIRDEKNRIELGKLEGNLYWSKHKALSKPSNIHWQKLKIKAIPIGDSELIFQLLNKQITLLEKAKIPILGGALNIKQFSWNKVDEEEPTVYFSGGIDNVSLEQLSVALNWTPLSGYISGNIPSVDYKDKMLTVNGGLTINLFDGVIRINKLASSGLLTDFSKFYLDMELDNLDLYALTQKFQMGGMEGRVSGFVTDLYLENWSPVTFYAWLGTPDDDNSRHRISQKAVQNLASVGGGGAADIISKGFLRFFETFGYDRLGFGCYLHHGVCQLLGVEAAEQGYYIVKGGGLPRIDVIGYNPQVDWDVLMQRLSRISMVDEVVVE